jgi:hypothetical protein
MASKITDYPAKTAFDDGDLYDVSTFDGVSAYTSEKMTFTQLKAELNSSLSFSSIYNADGSLTAARTVTLTPTNTLTFTGGKVTIVGEDSTNSNTALVIDNSSATRLMTIRNDGSVGIGTTTPTATFEVAALSGFGTILKGNSGSASEFTLQLKDNLGNIDHQFRNSGRAELGINGNIHIGGTSGQSEKLYVTGDVNVTGTYKASGTSGVASFTGAVTSITVTNGIVTAIS